jgi:hypothetical protein
LVLCHKDPIEDTVIGLGSWADLDDTSRSRGAIAFTNDGTRWIQWPSWRRW